MAIALDSTSPKSHDLDVIFDEWYGDQYLLGSSQHTRLWNVNTLLGQDGEQVGMKHTGMSLTHAYTHVHITQTQKA